MSHVFIHCSLRHTYILTCLNLLFSLTLWYLLSAVTKSNSQSKQGAVWIANRRGKFSLVYLLIHMMMPHPHSHQLTKYTHSLFSSPLYPHHIIHHILSILQPTSSPSQSPSKAPLNPTEVPTSSPSKEVSFYSLL